MTGAPETTMRSGTVPARAKFPGCPPARSEVVQSVNNQLIDILETFQKLYGMTNAELFFVAANFAVSVAAHQQSTGQASGTLQALAAAAAAADGMQRFQFQPPEGSA